MTDKRIPLDAQYGYAKVEEITPEQWEAFKDVPYVAPIKETMGWEECSAIIKESLQVQKIHLDAQQIIKAAVQAIEDVVEGDYGKYTDGDDCSHGKLEAEVCEHCIREHLIPHLQVLKGLLGNDYPQQNVSVAEESSVTQTPITWEQQAKRIGIAEFMGTPLTELSEHKQEVFWEFIRKKLKD